MKRSVLLRLSALTLGLLGVAAAQGKVTTIEYWHINTESFGGPAVRDLIKTFEAKNPGIKVQERFHQNAYTGLLQNLQAALAAGTPPDVAQVGYLYTNYVAENFPFVPTTTLAQQFNGAAFLKRFPANVLALGQSGGVQVGMPYSLSNIVTYYNADLLRQAGLDPAKPPKTWDEWRAAAGAIKAKTGKYGIYLQLLDDNWATEALMASNGGALLSCKGGTYQAAFASPQAAKALQFWADLVKDDLALNTLWTQGEQAFLAGESATFITTIGKRASLQGSAKFDLRGTTFPSFGTQKTSLPGGGNVLVVFSKDRAKQEAAWKFTQFLTSDEGFTAWTKGTGYVPLLDKLDQDPRYLAEFVKSNPIQRVGIQQLPNTKRWTSFPGANGLAASQALFKAVQRSLGGQTSAQAALNDAAQEINGLIKNEKCKP